MIITLLFSGKLFANNLSSFIINPVSHRIQPVNGLIFDCDCLQEKAWIQLRNSRLLNQLRRVSNRLVITDNNIIDPNLTEFPYSTFVIHSVIIFRWCSSFAAFFMILATYSSSSRTQAKSEGEDISLISSFLRLKVKIVALIIQRS